MRPVSLVYYLNTFIVFIIFRQIVNCQRCIFDSWALRLRNVTEKVYFLDRICTIRECLNKMLLNIIYQNIEIGLKYFQSNWIQISLMIIWKLKYIIWFSVIFLHLVVFICWQVARQIESLSEQEGDSKLCHLMISLLFLFTNKKSEHSVINR